jgi:hypothetical protein
MDNLRTSVPSKQSLLVDTEGAVKKQIETTIDEGNLYIGDFTGNLPCELHFNVSFSFLIGCASVRETAHIANTTLTNIQNATEHMNASTRSSIDSFNHFMDNAGDALRSQLVDHFDGLGHFLQSQEQSARTTVAEADKFKALSDASVVTSTGTTPVKKQFTPLRSLR